MDLNKIKEVLGQAAVQAADIAANSANQTVNTAVQKPGMHETIMAEGARRQANKVDKPINNEPKTVNPNVMYEEPQIPIETRKGVAKLGAQFIDAMDRMYSEKRDPEERRKILEGAYKYYTVVEPNEVMLDVINNLGETEQDIINGTVPANGGYNVWQTSRKWLKEIMRDPYGTGAGLV